MYPPATLPAQAPTESFLELLGDIEIDPEKLGTALPKLLGRLRPKLAYRVSGIPQFRESPLPDQYGVTVTVTAFLFGGSRTTTVWGSDWDDGIRKAGSWIVSTLLPVTRAGRLPPWRRWWGRQIKPELYEAYQSANELSRVGRYHEALEQYFRAVRIDPTNAALRAELAETQEKMGLHIDALDTCQRALTLDGQSARRYRKRLWQNHSRHVRNHRGTMVHARGNQRRPYARTPDTDPCGTVLADCRRSARHSRPPCRAKRSRKRHIRNGSGRRSRARTKPPCAW